MNRDTVCKPCLSTPGNMTYCTVVKIISATYSTREVPIVPDLFHTTTCTTLVPVQLRCIKECETSTRYSSRVSDIRLIYLRPVWM